MGDNGGKDKILVGFDKYILLKDIPILNVR